ncbi:MAG: type II toxin-antitoxin system Phd/YefM family antitoxin [Alphaproteobacteria bacterium]|nr:type II toxin-antitoxin system Phd/YefM family antitoxin [Alphaproteobacteria bacterium]
MTRLILSNLTASITELKKHPMATVNSAEGEVLAILNRNEPVFYCVPTKIYEAMMDVLEDIQLAQIVRERMNEEEIEVNINDL